ncbi:shikimate dehydrogenase [Pseudooceanicola sp. C21-150M6]|uniref:shikimate dehydrogenase n=1 Tax=Pseudooceanicola sp. C21-150M6 TaxID=3434355 RepID=UPI003D7F59E0
MTELPRIPLAGVIGAPVAHSKSPLLFRHWLDTYRLPGHYVPLHVDPGDFEEVLRSLPKLGFVGANVTIPHKTALIGIADDVTDRARQIGAANTVTFRDGRIHADNTDGYGFIENLLQSAPEWSAAAGPALILGAGGAARAVIHAMLEAGAPEIWLANRSRDKAEALADHFGARVIPVDWAGIATHLHAAHTVINTTSLGMAGKTELTLDLDGLHSGQLVTDIVYTPLETRLLREASARGCKTVDGLGMLLHQAVPGFERWFGQRPEVTEALRRTILS